MTGRPARSADDSSPPPAPEVGRPLRIVWSGDLGGQNVCRDAARGYPIFPVITARTPDVFIALGDMIYGDDACTAVGRYGNAQIPGPPPARDRAGYWAHWRYNRADPGHQAMLAAVSMSAVWDDHEICDDAGPAHDSPRGEPDVHLMQPALQAFLDYQPIIPPADDPTRMYRSLRWGKYVELFVLDTRQYRDANQAPDEAGAGKTMLGPAQRALARGIDRRVDGDLEDHRGQRAAVDPDGLGRARRLRDRATRQAASSTKPPSCCRVLHERGVRNSLWLTTDVHFATGFVYRPFGDDATWETRELITGPLNAGVFPNRALDDTFRPERLFFYGPQTADSIHSFAEAVTWFNFGQIEILPGARLSISIVNGDGQTVYRTALKPAR